MMYAVPREMVHFFHITGMGVVYSDSRIHNNVDLFWSFGSFSSSRFNGTTREFHRLTQKYVQTTQRDVASQRIIRYISEQCYSDALPRGYISIYRGIATPTRVAPESRAAHPHDKDGHAPDAICACNDVSET
ncbi:hypothetical protein EVAR_44344_1 [Eumeta japonica]|uniref:Uncharacterized protein n=1 Tax=Eumeta variegata TaxID=151549 RepID=A0A4C1XA52_EUMVA|nr:hypothetical protein EVAR_44344_1 [Eumeta japonica]